MMSRKVEISANKMVYGEGTFLWWWLCTPNFRTIAYVVDNQIGICRRYLPSVRGTMSVKCLTVNLVFNSSISTSGGMAGTVLNTGHFHLMILEIQDHETITAVIL